MNTLIKAKNRREWWRQLRSDHGAPIFCAVAPTPSVTNSAPRVERVQHLFSAGFERGFRTYAFSTEAARDAFVRRYRADDARACDDPAP